MILRISVLFLVLAASLDGSLALADPWKAGSAKVNITPEKLMWMSGYGARNKPAEGKLTDLWAKALVLEDPQGKRAVLVTMDLVGIDRDVSGRVCSELAEKYQLSRESIALSVSHTHTGPVVGTNLRAMYFYDDTQDQLVEEYTRSLEKKLVAVVGEAITRLAPATLSWGQGKATFAVNRRNNPEGEVPQRREQGTLRGPVDHDVPVLAVRDADGRLTTIVCGYACHATVLSFYLWSGDWPGFAQIDLEQRYPEAIAMVWAGCGADQNPLPRRQVEQAQQYGRALADAAEAVIQGRMKTIAGALTVSYKEIDLPYARLPTRDELERAARSNNRFDAGRAEHLLKLLMRDGRLSETYPYPVQVWQLGAGPTLIMLGGEVVVDYALRLKAQWGPESTWVMGYANDVMAYIPSERVLKEGGYEGGGSMVYYGLPSPWAEGVEQRIAGEVTRQAGAARAAAGVETHSAQPARYADRANLLVYLDEQNQQQPVKTPDDWARRREHILEGMQQAMGRLPDRSKLPPLDVKQEATEAGEGYVRLKITFAAEPGDRIPAHLYLPEVKAGDRRQEAGGKKDSQPQASPRLPAIVALHPTSPLGKLVVAGEGERPNRGYAVELAQRGYVVIAPDYPSFGDYKDYDFHADRYVSGTMKGIFNHMRCVDLLQSREEVEPQRIGAIGHSLGGHNAIFLGAFDTRVQVVVSSCGWTPFHDYYGGKIAGWTSDRYMPRLRDVYHLNPDEVPFDFYETVAALAPRAFYSCSPLGDGNFDVAGVKKAIPQVEQVYRLLGAEEQLVADYPDAGHDFPPESRRRAYEMIDRVLRKD